MSAYRCSVAHNYFHSSLRILFTAFLETQLTSGNYCDPFRGAALAAVAVPQHPPLEVVYRENPT